MHVLQHLHDIPCKYNFVHALELLYMYLYFVELIVCNKKNFSHNHNNMAVTIMYHTDK